MNRIAPKPSDPQRRKTPRWCPENFGVSRSIPEKGNFGLDFGVTGATGYSLHSSTWARKEASA